MFRNITLIVCTLVFSSTIWAQPEPAKPTQKEAVVPLNRIVAIVNDDIIPQSEVDMAITQLKQQLAITHMEVPSDEKLRQMAIDQLILYHLQLQMATRNQIQATDSEIDDALDRLAKSHNLSIDQLKAQMSIQKINYKEFRKKVGEQIIIGKLQQGMVAGQIKVTDEDISDYKKTAGGSQEYHVADFFFPLPEQYSKAQKQKALDQARNLQQQLNKGSNPDTMSTPYRDLGWRSKDDLPAIFAAQLNILTVNNASDPILAPNGYHVLKILAQRTPPSTLTDDQIRELLLRQKFQEAVNKTLQKARSEAYIQIMPQ